MKLLPENELIWSWVVANSKMNRERNASGINSYEQELGFKPEIFLEKRVGETGVVKWLDLCCGEGKALIQTAAYLAENGLQEKAMLTPYFPSPLLPLTSFIPQIHLKAAFV